jgi:cytochrome c oxidase subunit 2
VIAGAIVPAIVLLLVLGKTLLTLRAVAPPGASLALAGDGAGGATAAGLRVAVIGHDWWWEVRYPDHQVITANEIHVPVGEPVSLEVTAADVIHSFWVPQLAGKIDLIPGRTNRLLFQADRPGTFRGQCAEYCGLQHAHMAFLVIAQTPDEFSAWLAGQAAPAQQPVDSLVQRGAQVFAREGCISCHAVRYGSEPVGGRIGPDLTHIGSRSTIAAGTLPNVRGNLAGWIVNSQALKPGNKMPPMPVEGDDLQVLLDYLQSLR